MGLQGSIWKVMIEARDSFFSVGSISSLVILLLCGVGLLGRAVVRADVFYLGRDSLDVGLQGSRWKVKIEARDSFGKIFELK